MHNAVSVVIPAYLAEQSLPQTLDSVFAQTLPAHEVFVINDGSPDKTGEVARSYGERIIYIEQEHAGQGAARNRGLEMATGRFIAFLDADDYWLPRFLEECVSFLIKYPEPIAVSTGLKLNRGGKELLTLPALLSQHDTPTAPFVIEDFFSFWAEHDHVRTGSNLIRQETIKGAGYQRPELRLNEDLEYWAYISTFGRWGFIPEALWVGNSRIASIKIGWFRKYSSRRSLCPTVEQWEQRILPRLDDSGLNSFEIIRGRLAAMYAHSMILAGRNEQARDATVKYASVLPRNRLTPLLLAGIKFGRIGWAITCQLVRMRELQQSFF